jgi:uncharacterized protein YkwD
MYLHHTNTLRMRSLTITSVLLLATICSSVYAQDMNVAYNVEEHESKEAYEFMYAYLNKHRESHGLQPLTINKKMERRSRKFAKIVARTKYKGKVRLRHDTKYNRKHSYAEIACSLGNQYIHESLIAFSKSPRHNAIWLGPDFKEMGLGIYRDGDDTVVVVKFNR